MKHKLYITLLVASSLLILCFFPIYEMVLVKQFEVAVIIFSILLISGMMYDKLVSEKKQ